MTVAMDDILPFDVVEVITKYLDIHSMPLFRCSCKVANNAASEGIYKEALVKSVNRRLNDVVETIKEYHEKLRQPETRTKIICTILNELFLNVRKNPELHVNAMIHMIRCVIEKTGCNENDVNRVWFLYMNSFQIDDYDQHIVKALEEYTLAKSYSLLFQYTDCNNQGKHYIQLLVNFEDESKPTLAFTMQDIINDKDVDAVHVQNLKIQNAYYDLDGFMRFEISQENILAMSEFIVDFMGLDVFVFETDMVTYIKSHSQQWLSVGEDFVEKQVNKYVDREQYRDKIIAILDDSY